MRSSQRCRGRLLARSRTAEGMGLARTPTSASLRSPHPLAASSAVGAASRQDPRLPRLARPADRLPADLQHDRHRERRDVVEPLMPDAAPARATASRPAAPRRAGRSPHPPTSPAAACGRARGGAARRRSGRWRRSPAGRSSRCPGWRRSIRPAMIGAAPERALHQVALRQPRFEVVAQHVLVEQLVEVELPSTARRDRQRPDRHARSRWRRSPAARRRRAPAGGSAACRASGARAAPRTDRRPG